MKLYEVYTEILNEVGEGNSSPFPYDIDYDGSPSELGGDYVYEHTSVIKAEANGKPLTVYLFMTQNEYGEQLKPDELEVSFKTPKGKYDEVINDRVYLFRLMATIIEILKKTIKDRNIGRISFEPSKAKGEKNTSALDTKRSRLYLAFMKKAFPGATVEEFGDEVIITL